MPRLTQGKGAVLSQTSPDKFQSNQPIRAQHLAAFCCKVQILSQFNSKLLVNPEFKLRTLNFKFLQFKITGSPCNHVRIVE